MYYHFNVVRFCVFFFSFDSCCMCNTVKYWLCEYGWNRQKPIKFTNKTNKFILNENWTEIYKLLSHGIQIYKFCGDIKYPFSANNIIWFFSSISRFLLLFVVYSWMLFLFIHTILLAINLFVNVYNKYYANIQWELFYLHIHISTSITKKRE